ARAPGQERDGPAMREARKTPPAQTPRRSPNRLPTATSEQERWADAVSHLRRVDPHLRALIKRIGPGSKRGNKSPIDSPFLERLFPPCCGWLNRRTPFHGGNRHGLPGYFVRLGHAM